MTATARELKSRIEKLNQQHHPPRVLVLFGNEKPPEDATEKDMIVRFDEEDEGLL